MAKGALLIGEKSDIGVTIKTYLKKHCVNSMIL